MTKWVDKKLQLNLEDIVWVGEATIGYSAEPLLLTRV